LIVPWVSCQIFSHESMQLRSRLPKLVPKILYAFSFSDKLLTTMKTKLRFTKTCIQTDHSTLVMRASKPSPKRMIPDISRQSFSQDCMQLKCGLPTLVLKICYAFSFNEKLGITITDIGSLRLAYAWSIPPWWWEHHWDDCFHMFQAIQSAKNGCD
jgi:hypothetical protein